MSTSPLPLTVELKSIHKSFGKLQVLRGLDLSLPAGKLVTLLGVNGAGKTTTINIMLGLEKADAGKINILNGQPQQVAIRQQIGCTPQNTNFPEEIKVREIINFTQQHFPNFTATDELAEQFGLKNILERKTGGLSGGQKRRLAVALAFVGNPKLVFLDEPTTGLDVESRQKIWQAVRYYLSQHNTSIFLTTHYLEEAEALSDHIIILEQGKIKIEGSVDEIKALAGITRVCFQATKIPEHLAYVEKTEQQGDLYTLHTTQADELIRDLVHQDVAFRNLKIIESSLETAFLEVLKDSQA